MIEIGKVIKDFLFWCLMYLYPRFIRCCRCFFCAPYICTALIFIVADTFFETDVSATYFSLNLQMLFSLPIMYNCICILPFLYLADTPSRNFASSIRSFYTLQIPPAEILHLQQRIIEVCRYPGSRKSKSTLLIYLFLLQHTT